ncbi:MAG: hypothetical protein HY886_01290 [Deltaproteobacteria bacterium]|nr:hypothetical protein [Deltaproteobacteria bacterium]
MYGSGKKTAGFYLGGAAVAITAEKRSSGWVLTGLGKAHGVHTRAGAGLADCAKRAVIAAGIKKGGIAVSIPDYLAHVVILELDDLSAKESEADEMIRLKAGRFLNLSLLDFKLSHHTLSRDKTVKVLAVAVKRDIIGEIEDALGSLGLYAERINIHSLNLLNLLLAGKESNMDISVITFIDDHFTVMICSGAHLDYYRCKESPASGAARELSASFLSYRAHIGKRSCSPLEKVRLFGATDGFKELVKSALDTELEEVQASAFLSLDAFSLDVESQVAVLAALGAGI